MHGSFEIQLTVTTCRWCDVTGFLSKMLIVLLHIIPSGFLVVGAGFDLEGTAVDQKQKVTVYMKTFAARKLLTVMT